MPLATRTLNIGEDMTTTERNYILAKEGAHFPSILPPGFKIPNEFINRGNNCFVGIYYDEKSGYTFVGVPKYYSDEYISNEKNHQNILEHMDLVCKVIEKSDLFQYLFNPYMNNSEEQKVNKLELAEYIVHDYLENGLYGQYHNKYVTDGTGINDWNRTVQMEIPIINEDSIIYNTILSRKSQYNQNDIISKIHAAAIKQALRLLIGDDYKDVAAPDVDNPLELDGNDNLENFRSILYARLNVTFIERDKNLIKSLIAWCGKTINNEQCYSGSTSYELVWENVLNKVFGNIGDKNSGHPFYYNAKKEARYKGTGESKPDTLRIEDSPASKKKCFFVFDAKYYIPEISRNVIIGAPANSGIFKQTGYYHHLKKLYDSPGLEFKNSFLFPQQTSEKAETKDPWLNYWGYAKLNDEQNLEIVEKIGDTNSSENTSSDGSDDNIDLDNTVTIFEVNPTELYEKYLSDTSVTIEELESKFDAIEQTS